jgi:hypothetical protein
MDDQPNVRRTLHHCARRIFCRSCVGNDADTNALQLYIYPAARYIEEGERLCFFDVMARARSRREIVLGYKPFGMRPLVNPKNKSARVITRADTEGFVVMAEGDE